MASASDVQQPTAPTAADAEGSELQQFVAAATGADANRTLPQNVTAPPPAQAIDIGAAEDYDDFDDEALGSEAGSDTTSLTSSVLRHREAWGRTYHKFRSGENDYWGPNDEQQNDGLDIGHHMLTLLLQNRLYLAPIDDRAVRNVLDLGCGTGIWTIDFADSHKNCEVTGIDLSPIQPAWTPPNCHFVIDDIEDDWAYPDSHFDFIHIRCLMGSIKDWPSLYRQAYQRMKPGGWIQHLDMSIMFTSDDGSVAGDHIMQRWSQTFIDCGESIGKTFIVNERSARWMREAGFEAVEEQWFKVPVGSWPKDKNLKTVGFWNYHYCNSGAEGWALYLLTAILGWPFEACQVFIAQFRNALNDRRNHAYYNIAVVWGRKPLA